MHGALNNMGEDGSPLYVFTDAGPKDATEADIEDIKELAQTHGVAINFLTTGKGKLDVYIVCFFNLN